MGLPGTVDEPRPEDFGVTERQVEQAPELLVSRFRPLIFAALYLAVIVAIFVVILTQSRSLSAALTFSVILGAAASIVLIPFLICVLCASEKAETQWLCRKVPALESCLAYRDAVTEYKRRTRPPPGDHRDRDWWMRAPATLLRSQVERALKQRGLELTAAANREVEGYDFAFRDDCGDRVLVRCEDGGDPTPAGVGRELSACLAESGGERALLVTAGGPSDALVHYLMERPISVIRPWEILGTPPADL